MRKEFKFSFVLVIILSLFVSTVFAQEESDDGLEAQWAINVVSGSNNKVGKLFKGPFENQETAIANWYYYNLEPNKKYGLTKNKTYVTKNPEAFFRSIYESVEHDFSFDREAAIAKYNITKDAKIEKKYQKNIDKGGANIANRGIAKEIRSPDIMPNAINYDESSEALEQSPAPVLDSTPEQILEEQPAPVPPVEQTTVPEPEPEPEPQPLPPPEPQPLPETEPQPVPEIDFSAMMEELAKKPVQRYSKEYLQDYMTPDTIPVPEDVPLQMGNIENPNETDNFGQTLLMKASKNGNDWQIKTLLDSGADVNLQDKDGWTALMYAVRYQESLSTVQLLLNANADVKMKNKYDLSAIVLAACYNNNPQLLKSLLNYYSISDKEVLKSFILLLTTKQSSEYIQTAKLNVYLDKSIPLNNFYDGKTPLMYAAQFGNSTSVIQLLLDNGAATNLRSTDGKSAFDFATGNNALKQDETYWSLNRK